jgi:hypothetical protein
MSSAIRAADDLEPAFQAAMAGRARHRPRAIGVRRSAVE